MSAGRPLPQMVPASSLNAASRRRVRREYVPEAERFVACSSDDFLPVRGGGQIEYSLFMTCTYSMNSKKDRDHNGLSRMVERS